MIEKPPRPTVAPPNLENIPTELKQLPQWVFWRFELRQNSKGEWRWTKVPYGVGSQHAPKRAEADQPETWLPFHVAVQEWKEHSEFDSKAGAQFWDGIGFEFHPGGPYFGIDLDDCRDPESGNIETIAMEIVRRFNTYTEISPSKTGLKLIGKGRLKLPSRNGKPSTGRRRKLEWSRGRSGEIEVYDRGRYFAMTGDLLEASEP